MSDAPFLSVADTSQSMSVTDSFETHLMYIAVPDEFSTVWISLARADWAYSASWAKPWPFKLPIAQHVALFSPINGGEFPGYGVRYSAVPWETIPPGM